MELCCVNFTFVVDRLDPYAFDNIASIYYQNNILSYESVVVFFFLIKNHYELRKNSIYLVYVRLAKVIFTHNELTLHYIDNDESTALPQ